MEFTDYQKALDELGIENNIEEQISKLNIEYNMSDSPKGTILSESEIVSVTKNGRKIYSGFPQGEASDMVVLIWLKEVLRLENPEIVGLWWSENYDPDNLSAPRGVILPECVGDFKVDSSCFIDEEADMPPVEVIEFPPSLKP